jgi:hypothetical protein
MKILLIVAAFVILFSFFSCTKQDVSPSTTTHPENTMEVSFDVEEQVNVSSYTIELSETGNNFVYEGGVVLADNLALSKYSINVDITGYQKAIYVRIKSTDLDGQVGYSKIITARSN